MLCIDKLYSLCPSILKLPSDDKSSPSDLFDVAATAAACAVAAGAPPPSLSLVTIPPPPPPAIYLQTLHNITKQFVQYHFVIPYYQDCFSTCLEGIQC